MDGRMTGPLAGESVRITVAAMEPTGDRRDGAVTLIRPEASVLRLQWGRLVDSRMTRHRPARVLVSSGLVLANGLLQWGRLMDSRMAQRGGWWMQQRIGLQ